MPYLEREFNPAEASCGLQGIASSPSSTVLRSYSTCPCAVKAIAPSSEFRGTLVQAAYYDFRPIDCGAQAGYSRGGYDWQQPMA